MPRYHLSYPSHTELAFLAVVAIWMIIGLAIGKLPVFSRTKGPLIYDRKADWADFWLHMHFGVVLLFVGSIVVIATHISKDPQPAPPNAQAMPASTR
jgi:hypothetical protein